MWSLSLSQNILSYKFNAFFTLTKHLCTDAVRTDQLGDSRVERPSPFNLLGIPHGHFLSADLHHGLGGKCNKGMENDEEIEFCE